jgi:hypothetical protein
MHEGQRPHQCLYCPWNFNQARLLASHITGHRRGYRFKCQWCSWKCSIQINLDGHNLVCDEATSRQSQNARLHQNDRAEAADQSLTPNSDAQLSIKATDNPCQAFSYLPTTSCNQKLKWGPGLLSSAMHCHLIRVGSIPVILHFRVPWKILLHVRTGPWLGLGDIKGRLGCPRET